MIEIRKLVMNDIDALIKLLEQLWEDKQVDRKAIERVIENGIKSGSQTYICAFDHENLIGYCSLSIKSHLWREANVGTIDELIVDREYRNKGVGKRLMEEIQQIAQISECKRLDLESSFHRKEAHEFYEKLGFEKLSYLTYYYAKEI